MGREDRTLREILGRLELALNSSMLCRRKYGDLGRRNGTEQLGVAVRFQGWVVSHPPLLRLESHPVMQHQYRTYCFFLTKS
jgi:hypothetical protein